MQPENQNQDSGIIECEKELSNGLSKMTKAMYEITTIPNIVPCLCPYILTFPSDVATLK